MRGRGRGRTEVKLRKEFVVLWDDSRRIEIRGELILNTSYCSVEGIATGYTKEDAYRFRPRRIEGVSSERGSVWFERLLFPRSTIGDDERQLTVVEIRAHTMYWGAFDPTIDCVDEAVLSLGGFPALFLRETLSGVPVEERNPRYRDDRCLIETDSIKLMLEITTDSLGNHESQWLVLKLKTPSTSEAATKILGSVSTLIGILTNSPINTSEIRFKSGNKSAQMWHVGGASERDHSQAEWLCPPNEIVTILQKMLPTWLKVERAYDMGQVFLGAGDPSVFMESEFLTYCQCFEELNRGRCPDAGLMPSTEFEKSVIEVLSPVVESLPGIKSKVRRSLLRSIRGANSTTLSSRLRHVFSKTPDWIKQICQHPPVARSLSSGFDLFDRIEKRRNELSHGNPDGSVRSTADAHNMNLDSSLMFICCLTEFLFAGDLSEEDVLRLIQRSQEMSHVLWLAAQEAPA